MFECPRISFLFSLKGLPSDTQSSLIGKLMHAWPNTSNISRAIGLDKQAKVVTRHTLCERVTR